MAETKRARLELLRSELELERASWKPQWRDCADFVLPNRPRFFVTDANKGQRRSQKIYNTTASLAVRTTAAGMMAGITSPARPWFRLTTPDPDLAEFGPTKEWLHIATTRMATVFVRSNLYNSLPLCYKDQSTFGTAPISLEEDFEKVIRTHSFPIGSYMIAKDHTGMVNTFVRDFRMTVRQLVNMFGKKDEQTGKPDWSGISHHIRNLWDKGMYETWVDVVHVIEPNDVWMPEKMESKFKRYSSCYYERGTMVGAKANYLRSEDEEKYLREKGYDRFPILCPRWEVTGEDVYASDWPAATALGDIKQLQHGEKKSMKAVDKMVDPPMKAPISLRTQKASILPGDITYLAESQDGRFEPIHNVNFRPDLMDLKSQRVEHRIQRAFYEDLFLMLANDQRNDRATAREIEERHEEKLLALGPVLEQLNQDLLDPLIDITFDIMDRQGLIPPAPEELQGQPLKVEYVSIMAQAQKLVGIGGIERLIGFVGGIAQATGDPTVFRKINVDQAIDVYGDRLGVEPKIIRTDEEVDEMAQAQAAQQQAVQRIEMISAGAAAAKDLSQANMEGDSALTRLAEHARAGEAIPTAI